MILKEFLDNAQITEEENRITGTDHFSFSEDIGCNMLITYAKISGGLMHWDKPREATQHQPNTTSKSVYIRKRLVLPEKGQKYKSEYKQPPALFLNGLLKFGLTGSSYIVVVEGEKKAFVACKNGIPAVGIGGIHNAVYTNKDAAGQKEQRLIHDFADLFSATKAKKFILLFDADCKEGTEKKLSVFASAVVNFKAAFEASAKQELWFAHVKSLETKGLDDLILANLDRWARIADDLFEQELKSEFFSFMKLTGIKPKTINSYFLNTLTGSEQEEEDLYKLVQKAFWGGHLEEATLLSTSLKKNWVYNASFQKWMRYNAGKWHLKDNVSDKILPEIGYKLKALYLKYKKFLINEFEDFSKAEDGFSKRLLKISSSNYMVSVAKVMQGILSVNANDCDRSNLVLNCKNGELNLENFEFCEHSPESWHTKQCAAEYVENAGSPELLLEFLEVVMQEDKELIEFWQQWAGLCLSGLTDWQGFIYAYGAGANGKSTIAKVLSELLADYAMTVDIKIIMGESANSSDEYIVAGMKGARLVVGTEIGKGYAMNEARVKSLTGGDEIVGRPIRGNPIRFDPTAKYFFFGNHKLTVKGQDEGIWRRIYMIEFDYTIPEEARVSMSVLMREFKKEFPQILGWAVEGLKKYYENNMELKKPWKVKKSTEEYRRDNDTLAEFITERLYEVLDAGKFIKMSDVYKNYSNYCKEREEKKSFNSSRTFKKELKNRGYNIIQSPSLKQDVWLDMDFVENFIEPIYGNMYVQ